MPPADDNAPAGARIPNGAIGHVEIPAEDLQAARAFYSGVFGWTVNDVPGMDSFLLFDDGGFGGGLNGYPPKHGGGICPSCVKGKKCTAAKDCASGVCDSGTCKAASWQHS